MDGETFYKRERDKKERRPYPFEKEEGRSYPFEKEKDAERPYPFERKKDGQRHPYPFEKKGEGDSSERRDAGSHEAFAKGKGKKGGNSSLSFVRSTGHHKNKDYKGKRYDKKDFRKDHRSDERPLAGFEGDISEPMELRVLENTDIGTFLELSDGRKVLLPFAEQLKPPVVGEKLGVCLFKDKGDRITATMRRPKLSAGELGILKVTDVSSIGAFLDNDMPKDVLLPFREQIESPKVGQEVLVYIYKDKTGRMAATMRIYKYLKPGDLYKEDDRVEGFVYEINARLGVFVAVDQKYFGLIPASEIYQKLHYGDRIEARVVKVREDGKLDLSLREKSYLSIDKDSEAILAELEKNGGKLDYADKADSRLIEYIYGMSKNQFKRALGRLYKQRRIEIDREKDTVKLVNASVREKGYEDRTRL